MRSIPTLRRLAPVLALVLAGLPPLAGAAGTKEDADEVLAVVAGKPITQADVEESSGGLFQAIEREYAQKRYGLTEQALEQLVQQRLVEEEAKARRMTEEELLATIDAKPVTDADVDFFFEQNQQRIRGTKEQMGPQIKEYLEQLSTQEAQQNFYDELRAKHDVEVRLEPLRADVAATGPARGGPPDAPVTIIEFADFQCPYCVRILPAIKQVLDTYGDKVRFVYRHYPLSIHTDAQRAAEASMCAHEAGKFWEMHDAMFADTRALNEDGLKATAARIGLDPGAFAACIDSGRYADDVAADMAAGTAVGVTGTPAFFVNGRLIAGAVPVEQLTDLIDDELRRLGVRTASN
jgi:protein-disulfide isomerase